MLKKCNKCGNDFNSTPKHRIYCSNKCFQEGRKIKSRTIYWKQYYSIHKKDEFSRKKIWRDNNKDHIRDYTKKNQKRISANALKWHRKQRKEIIELLGSKCTKCGESDWRCLQIDHINGGGHKEMKSFNNYGRYIKYISQKIQSGSKDYQLLCANCNQKKRYENGEGVTI